MRVVSVLAVILLLPTIGTSLAEAQDAQASSFEALSTVLTVGQDVQVTGADGRTTRGKITSIADARLVVARRRLPAFRSPEERIFVKDVVRSVDAVDSTWNGVVIGLVTGGLLGVGATTAYYRDVPNPDGMAALLFVPLTSASGGWVGQRIDLLHNKRVYQQRPSTRPRSVVIAPLVGRSRRGIQAWMRF